MKAEQDVKLSSVKRHWYLIAAEAHFIRPAPAGMKEGSAGSGMERFNLTIQTPKKDLTAAELSTVNYGVIQQMEGIGIPANTLRKYVILNMMYLGYMSEKDFHAQNQKPLTH